MKNGKYLDQEGFDDVFKRYFNDLTRFTRGYVRDREAAKDIVHDAFLSLWNNRARLDASIPLKAYLITLTRNLSFNYLKPRRVLDVRQGEIIASWEEANEELEQHERRLVRLEEKLKELPGKQREIIVKCFLDGMTYKQVAEEMSISVNTVKTHLSRGLNFLRGELQDDLFLLLFISREKKVR
jgi:RNA polymerase sigma-70 factor (ECF subfamily)